MNDALNVARRLPRRVDQSDVVFVRKATSASDADQTMALQVRPKVVHSTLLELLRRNHPAWAGIEHDPQVDCALAMVRDITIDTEDDLSPADLSGNSEGSPEAAHVLITAALPPSLEAALDALVEGAPPAADAGLSMGNLQPRFAFEAALDEQKVGRGFFSLVFPHHFTNGHGGLDEADEEARRRPPFAPSRPALTTPCCAALGGGVRAPLPAVAHPPVRAGPGVHLRVLQAADAAARQHRLRAGRQERRRGDA